MTVTSLRIDLQFYLFAIELRNDCSTFQLPDDMFPLREEPRFEWGRHFMKLETFSLLFYTRKKLFMVERVFRSEHVIVFIKAVQGKI